MSPLEFMQRLLWGPLPGAMNVAEGSGVPVRPDRNRSFTAVLLPPTLEYPVLRAKQSQEWSIVEWPLTAFAAVQTGRRERLRSV